MYRNPVPVTRERHGSKRLVRYATYTFARSLSVVPIFAAELSHVALSCPIALVKEGNAYGPVALLSLEPDRNLLVGPDGRWIGEYIPAALRRYPFIFGRMEGKDGLVLCIDEESGLLSDTEGEPLYAEDGQPSPFVTGIMQFLGQLEGNRQVMLKACAALERHQLIVPWALSVPSPANVRNLAGLFRIDEAALQQLSDDAFLDLRQSGALPLCYAHWISVQRIAMLQKLEALYHNMAQAAAPPPLDMNEMFELPGGGSDFVFKF